MEAIYLAIQKAAVSTGSSLDSGIPFITPPSFTFGPQSLLLNSSLTSPASLLPSQGETETFILNNNLKKEANVFIIFLFFST